MPKTKKRSVGKSGIKARFTKKRGGTFTKHFRSKASRNRALKGWRAKGGKCTIVN